MLALVCQFLELIAELVFGPHELPHLGTQLKRGVEGIRRSQRDIRLTGQGLVEIEHSYRVLEGVDLALVQVLPGILDPGSCLQERLDRVEVVVLSG